MTVPIDPASLGAMSGPRLVSWTDRETLLYALGVGAGAGDLALTTENSRGVPQLVLPTFAVIVAAGFDVLPKAGKVSYGRMLHGSQEVRVHRPLPPSGELSVVSQIAGVQDKGQGRSAVIILAGRGSDPATGELVAETLTTLVFRGGAGSAASRANARLRRRSPAGRRAVRGPHRRAPAADLPAVG